MAMYRDALCCCRPMLLVELIAQKLSSVLPLAAKLLKCLMGQNVKSPFSNIRAETFKLHPYSSRIVDANRWKSCLAPKSP